MTKPDGHHRAQQPIVIWKAQPFWEPQSMTYVDLQIMAVALVAAVVAFAIILTT